jgi:hypothetical protein
MKYNIYVDYRGSFLLIAQNDKTKQWGVCIMRPGQNTIFLDKHPFFEDRDLAQHSLDELSKKNNFQLY